MAMWIGTLIHVIGIEFYVRANLHHGFECALIPDLVLFLQLRKTESKNAVREGFVLGPMTDDEAESN